MTNPITIVTASDDIKTGFDAVVSNTANQLKNWADTAAPTSPTAGQTYIDNTVASRLVMYVYQNGGWVKCVMTHLLEQNLECDGNQLLTALLEKLATGSLPAAGASTEARICWDTTVERGVLVGSATRTYIAETALDGSMFVRIPATMNVASLGVPATPDVATIFGGWTINQATEELNIIATQPVPAGYTAVLAANKNIALEVDVLLLAAETAGDDIDMDGTWEAVTDGAALGDDQVAFDAITHDISTNNGQYAHHRLSLVVDYDVPTANVAAGDVLTATINHNVAGQVAGVIVVGAYWKVPVANYDS